eukprot:scaffold4034_cov36-Prasinocladus_malaysianus.AAC.1
MEIEARILPYTANQAQNQQAISKRATEQLCSLRMVTSAVAVDVRQYLHVLGTQLNLLAFSHVQTVIAKSNLILMTKEISMVADESEYWI